MEFNDQNFNEEVVKSTQPVIVDFYANWCPPCKALAPVMDKVALALPDIKVGKVNIEESPDLCAKYNISSLPTIMLFRDGVPVSKQIGFMSEAALVKMAEKV